MPKAYEELVEEFHRTFGVPIGAEPTAALLASRQVIIHEEIKELFADMDTATAHLQRGEVVPQALYANMLKEMADVQTVLIGTSVALKPLRQLQEACVRVYESNMSKLDADGKPIMREDGKVLKGPNYHAPDLTDLV